MIADHFIRVIDGFKHPSGGVPMTAQYSEKPWVFLDERPIIWAARCNHKVWDAFTGELDARSQN